MQVNEGEGGAVPTHELWLWQNGEALESVRRGLDDAASGRVHDVGSFAQHADDHVDEQ